MKSLRFYNSLSKQVEDFEPSRKGKVQVYHCGPTVYKRQHIGNMRRYLFADFLRRSLEILGYEVREITNITDVGHLTEDDIDEGEDKLEKAAREAALSPQKIAARQTKLFHEDLQALNIQPSHMYPKATAHIEQMQKMIGVLLRKGHAYQTETGIYFDVSTFPDYGKLSGNTLEQTEAGARVAVRAEKKHPADFALWIFDTKQLQRWDSPWGEGYPGWHIECSAMSLEYLEAPIDIHTGGIDNKFPHHENEIAQSEAALGKPFVRTWMHNAHLQMGGKKLAKREGEAVTLETIQKKHYSPLSLRLLVFASHYRTPIDFSWQLLDEFEQHRKELKHLLRRLFEHEITYVNGVDGQYVDVFKEALTEDLNTPRAWAVFLEYVGECNKRLGEDDIDAAAASRMVRTLLAMDKVVGVAQPLILEVEHEHIPAEVLELVNEREEARRRKMFEEADRLRGRIETAGYNVEDTGAGPRVWERE